MKQLFWFVLGAAVIWFVSRQQMDDLYEEISQLREADRRRDTES